LYEPGDVGSSSDVFKRGDLLAFLKEFLSMCGIIPNTHHDLR